MTVRCVIRYPDDPFDRIWQPPFQYQLEEFDYFGNESYILVLDHLPGISSPTPPDNTFRADVNSVPPKVMQDTWLFSESNDSVSFAYFPDHYSEWHTLTSPFTLSTLLEYAYVAVYVEDLNTSSSAYSMDISLDNGPGSVVRFSNQTSMIKIPFFNAKDKDLITISPSAGPGEPTRPSINAVELHAQNHFNFSITTDARLWR